MSRSSEVVRGFAKEIFYHMRLKIAHKAAADFESQSSIKKLLYKSSLLFKSEQEILLKNAIIKGPFILAKGMLKQLSHLFESETGIFLKQI